MSAKAARIARINATRPFIHTYPATANMALQHIVSIPKGASRKAILRTLALIPNLTIRELP